MTRKEKIDQIRTRSWFNWADALILVAVLLFTAACVFGALFIPKDQGNVFSVYFRGEKIFSASLEKDADYLFYIEDDIGIVVPYAEGLPRCDYNRIRVAGGCVCVTEADCPDRTCIYLGKTDWGEIMCLPHDLRIDVEGEGLATDI